MAIYHTQNSYKAAYYPIRDSNEWPIANLIVLVSSRGFPLRAELHINTDAPVLNGRPSVEAYALAAAQEIVAENYVTGKADVTKLEVRPYYVDQKQPTEHFDLTYQSPDEPSEPLFGSWLIAAIAGILMILVGVVWGFSTLFNRSAADGIVTADPPSSSLSVGGGGSEVAVEASQAEQSSSASKLAVDPALPQTNGLPPSNNANELQLGQRVRVIPGSALTLRSAPGADGGETIGFLENAQEAIIIGGPYWVQGVSDTIVWWYIRLDGGAEAWAPANDSNFTLLEVAPRG